MCLVVNEIKTVEMRRQTDSIIVWKVYAVQDGKLISPLQQTPISIRRSGLIISNRQRFQDDAEDVYFDGSIDLHEVHRGIHVLLTREQAREYKKQLSKNYVNANKKFVIMRCEADMSNFVAVGTTWYSFLSPLIPSAVFMAIYISQENKKKALNGDFR